MTNDLRRSGRRVVGDYLRRWSIELLIKDENVLHSNSMMQRSNSAARRSPCKELRPPPIRQLKADLHKAVWNESIKDVAKASHERKVIRRLEKLLAA